MTSAAHQTPDTPATASEAVTPKEYRGWSISWDYGYFTATGPNYDASWEGEEDGWVDNGERVSARTLPDLYEEIDERLAPANCPVCGLLLDDDYCHQCEREVSPPEEDTRTWHDRAGRAV